MVLKKLVMKEPFKFGTFQLGYRWVDVYADPANNGGSFRIVPKDKKNAQLTVGMAQKAEHAWSVLMHEAQEAILCDMETRFRIEGFEVGSDTCFFHYDHRQHTEICSRVAWFMWEAREAFCKAHKKCNKSKKKK